MDVSGLIKRLGHLSCRVGLHDWSDFVYDYWNSINYIRFRRCQRCGREDRRE